MVAVNFAKEYHLFLFNCKLTIQYLLRKQVKPEPDTAVIELLIMGGTTPETC
jgi:hypothetical protein